VDTVIYWRNYYAIRNWWRCKLTGWEIKYKNPSLNSDSEKENKND
jgi:hypothetical protein